jgi:hypothetical protein
MDLLDFLAEARAPKRKLKKGPDGWTWIGHGGKYKGRFEVTPGPPPMKYVVVDHLTGDSAGERSLYEIEVWIEQSVEEKSGTFKGKWDYRHVNEARSNNDSEVESLLRDPDYGPSGFGVEFDGGNTLANTAQEVAYGLGYEEGRTGRSMKWTKDLLGWAKRSRLPKVLKMYKGGVEDGKATRR